MTAGKQDSSMCIVHAPSINQVQFNSVGDESVEHGVEDIGGYVYRCHVGGEFVNRHDA